MSDHTDFDDPEDKSPLKFTQWLAAHRSGALDNELTALLLDVAEEVRLHGKSGTVTLKLSLVESSGGISVSSDVKSTKPKVSSAAFYYLDEGRALTRNDPRQPTLPGTTEKEMNTDV